MLILVFHWFLAYENYSVLPAMFFKLCKLFLRTWRKWIYWNYYLNMVSQTALEECTRPVTEVKTANNKGMQREFKIFIEYHHRLQVKYQWNQQPGMAVGVAPRSPPENPDSIILSFILSWYCIASRTQDKRLHLFMSKCLHGLQRTLQKERKGTWVERGAVHQGTVNKELWLIVPSEHAAALLKVAHNACH